MVIFDFNVLPASCRHIPECRPTHQTGNEHGDNGEQQHAIEAGTDAAKNEFPNWIFKAREQTPSGVKLSCMPFTAPTKHPWLASQQSRVWRSKTDSYLPILPPDCMVVVRLNRHRAAKFGFSGAFQRHKE